MERHLRTVNLRPRLEASLYRMQFYGKYRDTYETIEILRQRVCKIYSSLSLPLPLLVLSIHNFLYIVNIKAEN